MKAGIKFGQGKDADKMITRKLLKNFIQRGKLTTTRKKAKFIKSKLERVVGYAKKDSQATKNKLKSILADRKMEEMIIKQIAPVFKERVSGFTKITYLPKRQSDASNMARVEWSMAVVIEEEKKEKKAVAQKEVVEPKKAVKKQTKPAKTSKKVQK